jgi:hypothetical protein
VNGFVECPRCGWKIRLFNVASGDWGRKAGQALLYHVQLAHPEEVPSDQ